MRFELVQRLAAPLEAVEATYADPDFLAHLAGLPKLGRPRLLEQRKDGALTWQRVRYAFVGELSTAVRAVVDPAKLTWVEEATIDSDRHVTTFEIQPDHYARLLEGSGQVRLVNDGVDGTLRRATGELTVHFALVGRKVEAAIVSGMKEHASAEIPLVERWVAEHANG